jgi:hypothetical protein
MFRMSMGSRTARGFAAAALILSLTATTLAGSAYAAPLAENDCSAAAHARNDAVHLLHTAWKAFDGDLKDLARDARQLQHESHKTGDVVINDARDLVKDAKGELKDIRSQAHEDIQGAVELGTACKDEDEDTTSSTDTNTTTNTNNTSANSPTDATPPADSTGSAHTFDTSGLDAKYKGIVDKAIVDMQKVVDDTRNAVMDLTTVAEEAKDAKDAKDDSKVKKDRETVKAEAEKAKTNREDAKKSDKAKAKSTTKAQNSGKGNGKDNAHNNED